MSVVEVDASRIHDRLAKIVAFFVERHNIPAWTDDTDRDTIDEIMLQWTRFMYNVVLWAYEHTSVFPVIDKDVIRIAVKIEQLIREIILEKRRLFLYRTHGKHRASFVTLTHYALASVSCLAYRAHILRIYGKSQTHAPEFIRYSVVSDDIFKMPMTHLDATRRHLAKIWRNEDWDDGLVLYTRLIEMRTFELIVLNQSETILNNAAYSTFVQSRTTAVAPVLPLLQSPVGHPGRQQQSSSISTRGDVSENFPHLPDFTMGMTDDAIRYNTETANVGIDDVGISINTDTSAELRKRKGKEPIYVQNTSIPKVPVQILTVSSGMTLLRFKRYDPQVQCNEATTRTLVALREVNEAIHSDDAEKIAAAQKRYDLVHAEEQTKYIDAMQKYEALASQDTPNASGSGSVSPPTVWKEPNDTWISDNFFFYRAVYQTIYHARTLRNKMIIVDSLDIMALIIGMPDIFNGDMNAQLVACIASAGECITKMINTISTERWDNYTEPIAFDLSCALAQDDMLRYRHPLKDTKPHSIAYMFNPREFNVISEYAQQTVEALYRDKRTPVSLIQFIQLLALKKLMTMYSRVVFDQCFVFGDDELDDATRAQIQSIPVFVKTFHRYHVFYEGILHRFAKFEWAIVFWAMKMYSVSLHADPVNLSVPVCGIRNICIDLFPAIADRFNFVESK